MDKKKVVSEIQTYLAQELSELTPGVETKDRIHDIKAQLAMYKFLPLREYGDQDVACPSALLELDLQGRRAFYFIVPSGGGLIMKVDDSPVQVITPNSPLGEALLGKRVGDLVRVQTQGAPREYRIVSMR